MTPLSINGGESPQISGANAAKGRKKSCQAYARATDGKKKRLFNMGTKKTICLTILLVCVMNFL